MKRPDFEYTVECGYYLCPECGTPWYPMEVDDNECPECLAKLGKLKHRMRHRPKVIVACGVGRAGEGSGEVLVHQKCEKKYRGTYAEGKYPGVWRYLYAGHPELPQMCAHCHKPIERGKEKYE